MNSPASGWQSTHSTDKKHVHTTAKDGFGRDVCTTCSQIVITPILSSDDPRLQPPPPEYLPLPQMLVALYYEGPEYGYTKAPIAPYVRDTAALEGELARYDPATLWDELSKKSKV